ncbi:LOW QUALITY PROTEIN: uncharacterized protein WCC33_014269 [Rhinophrynus dorsalis]
MTGVSGSVTFSADSHTLSVNLSGVCQTVHISLHEFPVTYGISQDPCHLRLIGPSRYNVSLDGIFQVAFQENIRLLGRSIVVETCGHRACANLHDNIQPLQLWHAMFQSFLVGHIYFFQVQNQSPIITLTELSLLEGFPVSAASMHFSNSCRIHDNESLATAIIGTRLEASRNRQELASMSVLPFILLEYQGNWACAEVRTLKTKEASAQFNMQGVNGTFIFKQESPFHQTQFVVSLRNLRGLAAHYGIHSLPVLPHQESGQNLCSTASTGETWNPFGVSKSAATYPQELGDEHNLWEMGDLSGRHGSLQGHQEFETILLDTNLPLYGTNSIIGRSVVLSKADGLGWVCSTIWQEGDVWVASASFHKGVIGRVMFRQPKGGPDEELYLVELSSVSGLTSKDHNWHVHELPLQTEAESCANVGGHFNPNKVPTGANYSQECKSSSPLLCEVGDYAGRHAPITLLGPTPARYLFTDTSSSLTGPKSIVGKSLVIHGPGGAIFRIACANIILQRPIRGGTSSWYGSGDSQGELKVSQISDLDPTSVHITFQGLKGRAGGFHIHLLPVTGGFGDPCSNSLIQGHFNPFGVNVSASPPPGNGTDDEYEVGDITGRRGSLVGRDMLTTQYLDMNFPLSGAHSILGRSLVIHYSNGSRMQCASLLPDLDSDGELVRAQAVFKGNLKGNISLMQIVYPDGGSSDTIILVDLQTPSAASSQNPRLQWYIPTEENGAQWYDPYEIANQGGQMSACGPHSPLHCAVGDLTAKHGEMSAGIRKLVTDTNLPLTSDFSVIGRTLTVKLEASEPNSAQILPDVPASSLVLPKGTPFNRSSFLDAVSLALHVPSWKVVLLPSGPHSNEMCQRVNFFIIGFNDTAALASLQSQDSLGPFNTSWCFSGPVPSRASSVIGLTPLWAVLCLLLMS